jgi:hypothetical protein
MSRTLSFSFEKVATVVGTYWRDKKADYKHLKHWMKQATIGGEQSEGFEQAFSSLAYAYLKDKAPRLLDFIIGFQLVERNDDNTKAVGIFGFKVGEQWLYAPVFFLNGDLKGHELLYLKKQDMFVPMKENWVNHVISRKPHVLGEASAKNTFQLGGLLPNLNRLANPPVATKFSSDLGFNCSEWAQPFLPFLAAVVADRNDILFARHTKVAENLDMRNVLRSFPLLKAAYEKMYQAYPLIKEGFDKFYGPNFWADMASVALEDAKSIVKTSADPSSFRTRGQMNMPTAVDMNKPMMNTGASGGSFPLSMMNFNGQSLTPQSGQNVASQPNSNLNSMSLTGTGTPRAQTGAMFAQNTGRSTPNAPQLAAGNKPAGLLPSANKVPTTPVSAQMKPKTAYDVTDSTKESRCWEGYEPVPGKKPYSDDSCRKTGSKQKEEKKSFDILPAARETHPIKTGALKITMQNIQMSGDADDFDGDILKNILPDEIQDKIADMMKRSAEADNDVTITDGDNKRLNSTDDDRKKLLDDGVLITDKRDSQDVSMAFNTQVKMELMNPNESGVYEVLEKPGTFTEMVVLSNPASGRGRENTVLVVRKDDPRSWLHTHRTNVFVKSCDCPLPSVFREWVNGLSDISDCKVGNTYVAIHEIGSGTCPFEVTEVLSNGAYRVSWLDHADLSRPGNLAARTCMHPQNDNLNGYKSWDAKITINNRPGTNLRTVAGEMFIPSDYKVIKVREKNDTSRKDDSPFTFMPCCESKPFQSGSRSDPSPIELGNLVNIQLMLYEKMASLKIQDTGTDFYIQSATHGNHRLKKMAAVIHLVADHGLAEKQARVMLKEASAVAKHNSATSYFVKHAAPFNNSVLAGGPNTPGFPEPFYGQEPVGRGMYPARYPEEYTSLVPGMDSNLTDPKIYDPFYMPDTKAMFVGQQASQAGQKEVFDTAMISGMLKTVRQDSLVDKYLGDLMKALDKLGRILFLFYWHQEEFEDRYGKQDLPELEDTLRNAFEVLGDLVLFLKEKTVQSGVMFDSGVGRPDPSIDAATGE